MGRGDESSQTKDGMARGVVNDASFESLPDPVARLHLFSWQGEWEKGNLAFEGGFLT